MVKTISMMALAALVLCLVKPATSKDPWALMGVTCELETIPVTISNANGCKKSGVRVQFCRGTCRSASQFQIEYPYYMPICLCCKKMSTITRPVWLTCPDGSRAIKYIKYASSCACRNCGT